MMQTIQKWYVIIKHPNNPNQDIHLYIYDNHFSNMVRKLADLGFDFDVYGVNINKVEQ